MANQNNKNQQKTPKSKIAVRIAVIVLAFLMLVGSIGVIVSGCQAAIEHNHEESDH